MDGRITIVAEAFGEAQVLDVAKRLRLRTVVSRVHISLCPFYHGYLVSAVAVKWEYLTELHSVLATNQQKRPIGARDLAPICADRRFSNTENQIQRRGDRIS